MFDFLNWDTKQRWACSLFINDDLVTLKDKQELSVKPVAFVAFTDFVQKIPYKVVKILLIIID